MTIKALSCAAATAVAIATAALTACTTEQYDAGDGKYSYLRSDFAEVTTDGPARMSSFVTDESHTWHAAGTPRVSWMTKSDTTYRALVYYATPSPQQHRGTAHIVGKHGQGSVLFRAVLGTHEGITGKSFHFVFSFAVLKSLPLLYHSRTKNTITGLLIITRITI